jgi:hypothetical protein
MPTHNTGARSSTRATTLQEKMGFKDADLTTPKHDAIMMWLDTEMDAVVRTLMPGYNATWDRDCAESLSKANKEIARRITILKEDAERSIVSRGQNGPMEEYYSGIREQTLRLVNTLSTFTVPTPPKSPGLKVLSRTWEYPIMARSQFMVGFVDMFVEVEARSPHFLESEDWDRMRVETSFLPTWRTWTSVINFLFEVKPTIPSLGEVIRQVRLYEQYVRNQHPGPPRFVVVCPDDKFASALDSQGISFIICPDV